MVWVLLLLVRFMWDIQSPVRSEHLKSTAPFRLPLFEIVHMFAVINKSV